MNIYTPHAINVGTTFCLLLASAGLVSTCPPANTAGQRALLIERIMRPPKIGNVQEAEDKARAIDLLADERAAEAILPLIDCLSDTRALHGSDNWVGGHATNALEAITGQHFGTDIETWRTWYRDGGAKQPGSVLLTLRLRESSSSVFEACQGVLMLAWRRFRVRSVPFGRESSRMLGAMSRGRRE